MIHTTTLIRRNLDGALIGALVQHVDGRRHALAPDSQGHWRPGSSDLQGALQAVVADLNATHQARPAPVIDVAGWLAALAADKSVKLVSFRLATLVAQRPHGWLGHANIAARLGMDRRDVGHGFDRLIDLGYLAKTRQGNRSFYRPTICGGEQ